MQIVLAERAGTAALHLFKIVFAAHVAHKDQAFNGLHVGACGDHIYGHGNAGIIVVAERAEYGFRLVCLTGDLFAKLVAFAEFLTHDLDNIIRVAVRFGKNQCLRHFPAMREQLRKQILFERTDHGADLTGVDHVAVQPGRCIIEIFVHLLPAFGAGQTVAVFDLLLHDVRAVFGDFGFNEEHVLADIDAVDDGLLP